MLRERRPELEDADLDRPFVELGLDSFDLISLRADLETRLGRAIPDARWQSLRCPADLAQPAADRYAAEPEPSAERRPAAPPPAATVVPMAKPRVRYSLLPPQRGDAPDGPAALPPNERHYRINLPQMAMRGLSEGWLFRELGDLHWAVLMHELKTQSASLADGAGHRLYATFTRVAFTSNVPLTDYRENERLAIRIDESRFGAAMFFGDARIEGVRGVATARLMTTFARFGEAGANTSLLKGQPVIPPECAIRDLGELPPFAVEYRQLRATPLPPAQAELDYEIQPFHDINGVGLLYFAAYPAIAELCLTRLKGPAFAFETSTVERDICYFANAEPTDTLIFRLHDWAEDDREVRYLASLARKSDGVTMARIRAVKRRVKLPPPGRPVEVED
ncbi:MAG: phosphopantetheine-binding protein [Sphingomonadaceae bacterium]|nr:phosphopantetheine-binding protein [Sphingomonadaceae bacterium]